MNSTSKNPARTLTSNGSLRASMMPFAAAGVALSAAGMIAVQRSGQMSWLSWVALLPLFQVIRVCSPRLAAGFGALWGASAAAMIGFIGIESARMDAASSALMVALPAMYCFVAAYLSRRIGFSPFILAVGWLLLELSLRPVGLPVGLAAGAFGGTALMHWIGGLLGYVFVAFIVILVNAAILSLLSQARFAIRIPLRSIGLASPAPGFAPIARRVPRTAISQCRALPRAPPF